MQDGGDKHHEAQHKSFDCSIMDLSDDIAFGVHDLEDTVALGLLRQNDFRTRVPEDACASYLDGLKTNTRERRITMCTRASSVCSSATGVNVNMRSVGW